MPALLVLFRFFGCLFQEAKAIVFIIIDGSCLFLLRSLVLVLEIVEVIALWPTKSIKSRSKTTPTATSKVVEIIEVVFVVHKIVVVVVCFLS